MVKKQRTGANHLRNRALRLPTYQHATSVYLLGLLAIAAIAAPRWHTQRDTPTI